MSPGAFALWIGLVACVAALPILATPIPPLLDYPNHLSRIAILKGLGPADAFAPNLRLLPNLGMDGLMLALASFLPLPLAGRLSIVLVVVLLVTGFARLHAAATGERSPWAALGASVVFTLPMMFGFLNFELGLALALHFLATDLRSEPGWPRTIVTIVFGFALLLCHLMGLGFALLLLPLLGRLVGRSWGESFRRAAPLLLPLLAYVLFSPRPSGGGGLRIDPSSFALKRIQLGTTFITGHAKTDLAFLALALLALVALLATHAIAVRWRLLLPGLLFIALWLLLPFGVAGTANLDGRFPGVFVLLLLLAFVPGPRASKVGSAPAFIALGGLLLFRSTTLAANFRSDGREIESLRVALARLPPGAAIIPIRDERALVWDPFGWRPPLVYGAHLATLSGHYVAGTFSDPTQQPIVLQERYRPIADYRITLDLPATLAALRVDAERAALGRESVYVYYLPSAPVKTVPGLTVVASGDRWLLGRLR